jgi:hypothetical protein
MSRTLQMHSRVHYWHGKVAVCVPMAGIVSPSLRGARERSIPRRNPFELHEAPHDPIE